MNLPSGAAQERAAASRQPATVVDAACRLSPVFPKRCALREKAVREWAKLNNAPIRPEHINCTGCKSLGARTYYCDQLCETRKCALDKSVGTCADCSDYPCSVLDKTLQMAPQAKATLDELKKK
ncbi:MAG: DUF3795 domain-containing protein [Candidatus Fermentibacter sp.]|nr:DUF3795 domain-containing protein [Candidatus Fermentibacter sp.]